MTTPTREAREFCEDAVPILEVAIDLWNSVHPNEADEVFTDLQRRAKVLASISPTPPAAHPAVAELIEMLSVAVNEEGRTVFDHTPEEIGLVVMENHRAMLVALGSTPPAVGEGDDALNAALCCAIQYGGPNSAGATNVRTDPLWVGDLIFELDGEPGCNRIPDILGHLPADMRDGIRAALVGEGEARCFMCFDSEDGQCRACAENRPDLRPSATLRPSPDAIREALDGLQQAEAEYRQEHDRFGDEHMRAGRAWDRMRRAGDRARAALATPEGRTTDKGEGK